MRPARRRLARSGAMLAATGLAATGLTGCQLFEIQEPEYVPSALETCVTAHTWQLDTDSLVANVAERLAAVGATGDISVEGSQRLDVSVGGALVLDTDLVTTVTNAGPPIVVTEQTVRGTSTGAIVISGDVAVPRGWSVADLTVTEQMTSDDAPVDPIPWQIGRTWIDDTVGLVLTCSADTLRVAGRGTKLAWVFHPEGWAPPAPTEEPSDGEAEEPAED